MARIGQLFVTLDLIAKPFNDALKQTHKNAKDLEKSIRPLKDGLKDLGTGMLAVGSAVTGALALMARQAANYGDSIRDAAIRTGLSTEALSKLKFAAEQSGTSFESLTAGLTKMSRNALAAAQGNKETAAAFKALGISVKDASGQLRSQDSILEDARAAFSKMADGTAKAALEQKIFGKGAVEMTEFLSLSNEEMAALSKQAEYLGLVLGKDAADAADKFKDSLNALDNAELGLAISVGNVLLPALTKTVELMTIATVQFRKFAEAHPDLIKAVSFLAAALVGNGGLILGLTGVLLILPKLQVAFKLLLGPIGLEILAVETLVAAFLAFPKFRGVVLDVLRNVIAGVTATASAIVSLGDVINKLGRRQFTEAFEALKQAPALAVASAKDSAKTFDDVVNGISDTIKSLNFNFGDFGKNIKDKVIPPIEELGNKAKDAAKHLAELILSAQVKLTQELPRLIDDINYRMEQQAKEFARTLGESIDLLADKLKFLDDAARKFRESSFRAQEGLMNDLDRVTKQTVDDILKEEKRKDDQRKKDLEEEKKRAEEWRRAWSTAIGNVMSSFAENVVRIVFPDFKALAAQRAQLESQITSIQVTNERERLQNIIDNTKLSYAVRKKATADLQAFNKQVQQQELRDRNEQLVKLQKELADANNLFKRFATGVKDIFVELGKTIVKALIINALTPITNKLTSLFQGLLPTWLGGIKKAAEGAAAKTATSAAGNVTGSVGTGGGGISAAAGGAGSTAGQIIGAGLGFIGDIAGIFQQKRLEGTMNAVEANTRFTYIELRDAMNEILWPTKRNTDAMVSLLSGGTVSGGGRNGPGAIAAIQAKGGAVSNTFNVNATLNLTPTIQFMGGGELTTLDIRDRIMPELMTMLDTGVRGYAEKIAKIVSERLQGLTGTEVPVGI